MGRDSRIRHNIHSVFPRRVFNVRCVSENAKTVFGCCLGIGRTIVDCADSARYHLAKSIDWMNDGYHNTQRSNG